MLALLITIVVIIVITIIYLVILKVTYNNNIKPVITPISDIAILKKKMHMDARADAKILKMESYKLGSIAEVSTKCVLDIKEQIKAELNTDNDAELNAELDKVQSIKAYYAQAIIDLDQTMGLADEIAITKENAQNNVIKAMKEMDKAITEEQKENARINMVAAEHELSIVPTLVRINNNIPVLPNFTSKYNILSEQSQKYCTVGTYGIFKCDKSEVADTEIFTLNMQCKEAMNIKSSNGKYCSNNNGKIVCNSLAVGELETFTYNKTNPNTLSLQNQSKYCIDDNERVLCKSDHLGSGGNFTFIPV